MKSDIWYPFYIGDYQRDTQHLTTLEHGAYRLLLDTCWTGGGTLRDDDGDLARITKLSLSDWQAIRSRVAGFFEIHLGVNGESGFWTQKRVTLELEKARKQYERKSLGASKTNEKRWGTPSLSDSLSGSQCVSPSQPQPQPPSVVSGNGPESEVEFPRGFPMTLEAAIAATFTVGATRELVEKTWNLAMGRHGHDGKGQPILSWAHYVSACKSFDTNRVEQEKKSASRVTRVIHSQAPKTPLAAHAPGSGPI